jgi:hypothetical protein
MRSYFIYRDGDEVETNWASWKLDSFRRVWAAFRQSFRETDWLHYFSGNGPGRLEFKEFSGFRKMQNHFGVVGECTICVVGGRRRPQGECYYRFITIFPLVEEPESESELYDQSSLFLSRDAWPEYVRNRVAMAEDFLMMYLQEDCTCRVGFHRRCPHHFKTRD